VRRATEQALAADLVLWVTDAAEGSWREPRRARDPIEAPPGTAVWVLLNKIDLLPSGERALVSEAGVEAVRLISGATGEGVDELISALTQFCELYFPAEPALVTRERQRAHLQETALALRGVQAAAAEGREEIVAEQLRLATRALGKLLGRVDVEDILDVIFRDFCIGK
jgi:tRNA modification GTPase